MTIIILLSYIMHYQSAALFGVSDFPTDCPLSKYYTNP